MVSVESVIHIAIQWTSVWETIVLSSGQRLNRWIALFFKQITNQWISVREISAIQWMEIYPVAQNPLDSVIHRINHYPVNKCKGIQLRYPRIMISPVHSVMNNQSQAVQLLQLATLLVSQSFTYIYLTRDHRLVHQVSQYMCFNILHGCVRTRGQDVANTVF